MISDIFTTNLKEIIDPKLCTTMDFTYLVILRFRKFVHREEFKMLQKEPSVVEKLGMKANNGPFRERPSIPEES